MNLRKCLFLSLFVFLAGCSLPESSLPVKTSNLPVPAIAMMPHPRLTISLDRTFPEYGTDGTPIRANFETLAHDVLQVVQNRFKGRTPADTRPVVCYISSETLPRTSGTQDPAIIWVGLVLTPDRLQAVDYSKFAYQLAHELGHVMMGTRRSNGLIETLADALSYQALTDLSELWPQKYPNLPAWRDWAYNFQDYRNKDEQDWLARFPQEVQNDVAHGRWEQVTACLKPHQAELDSDPYTEEGIKGHALRSLNAMALLSQPVPWEDFTDLTTYTDPSPQQDTQYRNDLPVDLSRTPASVQEAVGRFR